MRQRTVVRAIVVLIFAVVISTLLVPASVLDKLAWLWHSMDFLDTVAPGLQASHLLAFAVLGFAARLGWPNGRAWKATITLVALAAVVESVQILVPGREAKVSHAILEAVGGMLGFALAWLITYAWGATSVPAEFNASTHWTGNGSSR